MEYLVCIAYFAKEYQSLGTIVLCKSFVKLNITAYDESWSPYQRENSWSEPLDYFKNRNLISKVALKNEILEYSYGEYIGRDSCIYKILFTIWMI